MKNKSFICMIILILLFTIYIPPVSSFEYSSKVVVNINKIRDVGYDSIQDAIDVSDDGDTTIDYHR